jgi:hypothetical protein
LQLLRSESNKLYISHSSSLSHPACPLPHLTFLQTFPLLLPSVIRTTHMITVSPHSYKKLCMLRDAVTLSPTSTTGHVVHATLHNAGIAGIAYRHGTWSRTRNRTWDNTLKETGLRTRNDAWNRTGNTTKFKTRTTIWKTPEPGMVLGRELGSDLGILVGSPLGLELGTWLGT